MTEKSSALHKNQRRGRDWLRCILHRLTPISSARRRGPSKACEAISYCVAPFCFPHLCLQASLALLSLLYKLHTAVLRTAFIGIVVGDRAVLTLAHGGEAVLGDAEFHQLGDDSLRTLLAEGLVASWITCRVGMTFYRELQVGVFGHQLNDAVDFTHRFGLDSGLAPSPMSLPAIPRIMIISVSS